MKADYTHIMVILDRSGSMESIRDDTIGGFNAFLEQQRGEAGTATLTLIQFDSQDPFEVVYRFKPLAEVAKLDHETYVPRGGTPLLDAIGRGINQFDADIAALKVENRPSQVRVAIVTDGRENASKEFNKSQIAEMIKLKVEKSAWEIEYLSTDLSSFDDARALGIPVAAMHSFEKSGKGVADAWAGLSARTADFRSAGKRKIGFGRDAKTHPAGPGAKQP